MANFPHWDWNGQDLIPENSSGVQGRRIAMAASRDARGQIQNLELVYIGLSNYLHHIRQMVPGDSTSWAEIDHSFVDSGSGQTSMAQEIAIGQNGLGDSRLELFYVGNNSRLYRNRQIGAATLAWEGETTPFGNSEGTLIDVTRDQGDRLEIVYTGTAGGLYHNRQNVAGDSNWVGETPFPGLAAKAIAIARNPNRENLLEIFYVGGDNKLRHIRQFSTAVMTDWTSGKDILDHQRVYQVAVGTNADGRLELFYIGEEGALWHSWQNSTADTSTWSGPVRFPGNSATYVTVVSNADGRLEIFYLGRNQELFHNWQYEPNGNWLGETRFADESGLRVAGTLNRDGRMEMAYLGTGNYIHHHRQIKPNGAWTNTNGIGGVTPAPPRLANNSNYFLTNCGLLTDVAVTIDITQDLFCDKVAPPGTTNFDPTNHGYSFQLNCWSLTGQHITFQQYLISVGDNGQDIRAEIDNSLDQISFFPLPITHLCSVPGKISAGFRLQIILLNDDDAHIIGATFRIIDNHGKLVGNGTIMLVDTIINTIAPITACSLNIVGQHGEQIAHFPSGAGTITYTASTLMTPAPQLPPCTSSTDFTFELSNSTYGPISPQPSNFLSQTFGVS